MTTKLLNFTQDREFQFRAAILGVIILFMGWQFYTVANQKKEIVVLKKEKEHKQALLLAKKNNKNVSESASQTHFRLEGTTIQDGAFQALINGAIYKVGDFVDQYKVTEITLKSSTLKNPATNEVRRLEFGE